MRLLRSLTPATRAILLGLLGVAVCAFVFPRPAYVGCGIQDPGACVDSAQYTAWYGLATLLWTIDKTLLSLVYQLDHFRAFLVDVAFTSAYAGIVDFVNPVYVPAASLALVLGCVLMMIVPLSGHQNIINVRHVIIWMLFAPLLLATSGQMIAQLEDIRMSVGQSLFTQATALAPSDIFGASDDDMPPPAPLYPSNPCGTVLARPGSAGDELHLDDLAAAMLWADAADIYCPEKRSPSSDIPDKFYTIPPQYAFDGDVGNLDSASARSAAISGIQRGATRLLEGILPCLVAVFEVLIQLIFSLSLMVLWVGLPFGLIIIFFQRTSAIIMGLFRQGMSVLQVSWTSSFVIGLIFAAIVKAAQNGNTTSFLALEIAGILIVGYLLILAVKTFGQSISTLNTFLKSATGMTAPEDAGLSMAGRIAAGVATGYVAGAVLGKGKDRGSRGSASSSEDTTSRGSGPGQRSSDDAQLGEIAADMGYHGDDETLAQEIAWYDSLDGPSQRQQNQRTHLEEVQGNRARAGVRSQIESARAHRDFAAADQLYNRLAGLETAAAMRGATSRANGDPRYAARDAAAEDLAESRRAAVPIATRNNQARPGDSEATPIHQALQSIIDKRHAQPPVSPVTSPGDAEAEQSLHSPPAADNPLTSLQEALETDASTDPIVNEPPAVDAPTAAASADPGSAMPEPAAPAPAPTEESTPSTPVATSDSTETRASVKRKRKKPAPAPAVTPDGESIVEYGDEPAKPPRKPRNTTAASADTPAKPRATRKRAAAKADPATVDTGRSA